MPPVRSFAVRSFVRESFHHRGICVWVSVLPVHAAIRILLLGCLLDLSSGWCADPEPLPADEVTFFESKVRPLLVDHCYECHSEEAGASEGDFLIDSRQAMRRGGPRGTSLVPGRPQQSLLMKAVRYQDSDLQMPPDGKLDDEVIAVFREWIQRGAVDPREANSTGIDHASPLDRDPRSHWAFIVPQKIDRSTWKAAAAGAKPFTSHDPIDMIASVRATEQGLTQASPADRRTLIRRLYFDLLGTPPTFDSIERFATDRDPMAYRRLVDELLARPGFGERFGRHWLDVARYANTIGYGLAGRERRILGSERYRDWVIQAFSSDLPYDEMLVHQLAGDRTDPNNQSGNLDAMGFLTVGRRYLNKQDVIDDRIDVVTRGLLGMTVSCARCHDHKFDPIPTSDYYGLHGIFESSRLAGEKDASPLAMFDKEQPKDSPVFLRGQPGRRGPIAPRQYLTSLRRPDDGPFRDGSGRYELAQEIATSRNPLTARVLVNRIWTILIGKPLVNSPSDFGFRTPPPAIPEVLDDLAADFADHWSIKRLVRRIVLTRIYQQSVGSSEEDRNRDPDNQWLARGNRRRRDFESLRDSHLAISGHLNHEMAGKATEITLPQPSPRKTVYAFVDRQNLPSLFRTFDFASPDAHAPLRYYTTVPQQALYLLNHGHAAYLAKNLVRTIHQDSRSLEDEFDEDAFIRALVRRVWSREPSESEQQMMRTFLNRPAREIHAPRDARTEWSYGLATLQRDNGKPAGIRNWTPFEVFANNRWQATNKFPSDEGQGHAFLGVEMGHPGPNDQHIVVRRWTAPASGRVRISGMIGHRSTEGDGVVAMILAGEQRLFLETQKSNNRPFRNLSTRIRKGETLEFAAIAGNTANHDSFFWRIKIRLTTPDGKSLEADSTKDFSGPRESAEGETLDRKEQLAQVLLLSNEFTFVD